MINIQTVKLPQSTGKIDLLKSTSSQREDLIRIPAANAGVDAFAKDLTPKLKNLKCEDHPTKTSVLKLVADKKDLVKVDKTGFCCKKFADSIKVTIKK